MANEGYIPYGLDRSSRSMDEILDARRRMRNANIEKSLVVGEELQAATGAAIEGAGAMYELANKRLEDDIAVETKRKANIERAKVEVAGLDNTIKKLQDIAAKNPAMAPEIAMRIAEYENRRNKWQSVLDSFDKEELAKVLGAQQKRDAQMAKASAQQAEASALSKASMSAVTDKLNKLSPKSQSMESGPVLRSLDIKAPQPVTNIEEQNMIRSLNRRINQEPLNTTVDLSLEERRGIGQNLKNYISSLGVTNIDPDNLSDRDREYFQIRMRNRQIGKIDDPFFRDLAHLKNLNRRGE